jgi:hypothetical protein
MSKLTDTLKAAAKEAAKQTLGATSVKDALKQATVGKEKKGKGGK